MIKIFFLFLLLLTADRILAQDPEGNTVLDPVSEADGMFSLNVSLPSSTMKELTRNNMFGSGIGGTFLYLSNPATWGKRNNNSMIRIGGELGYTYFGRFITDANINGYSGDYKTSYGIAHLNAVLRLRPASIQPVVPFADLFVGGNFYFSTIKENLNAIETSLGLESIDFGGTTSASFVKGVGAGISFGSGNPSKTRFILRATYTRGGSLRYIVRNSLQYDPSRNALIYQTAQAPIEYLLIQIGIGL